ncbi:MAG: thioredoxin domain-containing protein [Bdellovibrionota bacterium]
MSASKFIIGGIFVLAAVVSVVPLFRSDFKSYSMHSKVENTEKEASQKNLFFESSKLSQSGTSVTSEDIGSYNGVVVKRSDLNPKEKQSLFDAETQIYKAQENILARKYFDSIIEKYAKDKKILDKNEARKEYISENVKVADKEIKDFIQQNIDNPQLKGKSTEEQMSLVKPYLAQQAAGDFFRDVVAKAKEEGLIKVTGVQLPESPRIQVDITNAPSKGSPKAPITIVEFADFQCPYCYSVESTVKAISEKYKNQIHFVFRSYPLIQLHPQAVNASVAAECAQNQGKFWEMHGILFENHAKLADNVYDVFAKKVGLDMNKFQSCFKDSTVREKVMNDAEYGQSLGINATPAFYINGILIMGAQAESEFMSIIDKELAKK